MTSPDATRARAAQAARIQGLAEMASRLGHEINNTLAAIVMQSEMLLLDLPADVPARASAETIETAARQGTALIQRVRELARLARPLTPEPVALAAAVDDALGALRRRIVEDARWDVVAEQASVPPIAGNRAELALAVRHLVANALDAMPRGGRARVMLGADSASIYCRVVDEGEGITPETHAHAFEPFFSTRGGHGRGLGLTVALAVAVRHGGDVELTRATSGGTTATLRLPRPARHGRASDGRDITGG